MRPSDYGGIKGVKFGVIIHSEQVHVRYSDVSFIAGLGNYYLCILQKGDVFLFREMNNIILCFGGVVIGESKMLPSSLNCDIHTHLIMFFPLCAADHKPKEPRVGTVRVIQIHLRLKIFRNGGFWSKTNY